MTLQGPGDDDRPRECMLEPVDPGAGLFLSTMFGPNLPLTVKLLTLPDGSRYVHTGGRTTPRRA